MNIMTWLMENKIKAVELARMMGVHRMTIWKISVGKKVDIHIARAIKDLTKGKVKPIGVPIGRPRKVVNKSTK